MAVPFRRFAGFLKRPHVLGAGAITTASFLGGSFSIVKAEGSGQQSFTMQTSQFDQSTFAGRYFTIIDKIDPRTLFVSNVEAMRCQELLAEYQKDGKLPAGKTDEEMWAARKTVEAILHPVTKEPMFVLGRMSCFLAMNVPIAVCMLSATTTPMVVFSQWINQSYNVMNNYVNRSSLSVDWAGILKPYALAVTVSCAIALGARRALASMPALAKLGIVVPYLAVIAAGSCNVAFTRLDEWNGRGICIVSPEGKELGMSVKAGQTAVASTILTRSFCLPMPVLLVTPVIVQMAPFTGIAGKTFELLVIITMLGVALPCALAILPQDMEIDVASLEPEYHHLKDTSGQAITKVVANKGL